MHLRAMLSTAYVAMALVTFPAHAETSAEPRDVFAFSTRSDNKVHLVSATDLAPIATIDAQVGAHELAISPDGRWLVGSAYGGPGQGHQPPDKRLTIVDLKKQQVHRVVDLQLERPNDIAFLSSGKAIVTTEAPPRLVEIDPSSGEFRQINVKHPANHMMALAPDGKTAYVAHVMPGSVSVIDLASGALKASIETATGAEGIACSPDGKQVWVACNRADVVCIIDTHTHGVARTIIAKGFPFRVRFSPDGSQVAISFPGASEVRLFDRTNPQDVRRISLKTEGEEVPVQVTSIAFSPDGTSLAAVCDGKVPQVVRIDVKESKVTHRIAAAALVDALTSGTIDQQ